jgi:hypothetical protein
MDTSRGSTGCYRTDMSAAKGDVEKACPEAEQAAVDRTCPEVGQAVVGKNVQRQHRLL